MMRSDYPGFIIRGVFLGTVCSIILWLFFNDLPGPVYLIPIFWVLHVRSMNAQLEELNDRLITTMDLMVSILEKDPNFDVREYFENNGIDDDDDFK